MKAEVKTKKGVMPAGKYADGGAVKGKPFGGKQTPKEEMAEAKAVRSGKVSPAEYARKEKAEGDKKPMPALMAKGKALASGKTTPGQYAAKATGKPKK
jgi:hypothetical protein